MNYIKLFENYSADFPSKLHKQAQKGNINYSLNYVPFARIDDNDIPLVAKNNNSFYGYDSEQQASIRIQKAKKLPAFKNAQNFYIQVMAGDKIIDYIDYI